MELQRYDEAVVCFTKLIKNAPDFDFAKGRLLNAKMYICDWIGLTKLYDLIKKDIFLNKKSAWPFGHQAICDSEAELHLCAKIYAVTKYPDHNIRPSTAKIDKNVRIRIGYLSGEFRQQATSILITQLFEFHDKNAFEIFAFDNGFDDGGELRRRINCAFDGVIQISKLSNPETVAAIKDKKIDILVNLNGYFGSARQTVFSYKPSPIQVNYLGFPGTLGSEYVDYLIADSTVIPESSQQHYSEKIIYLPNSYQVNDNKRPISNIVFSKKEQGLPDSGFVFCSFNNNYKITPKMFDRWMRILKRVQGSVLWLIEDNPWVVNNLQKEAEQREVKAERIVFAKRVPLAEHLARHKLADLFLDTLPYNAHTTASDALWAGLPVLTCLGTTFPGRVAASLLKAIDLPELITRTQKDYEALAIELATDAAKLAHFKQKLTNNRLSTMLFNTQLYTKHIEAAYTAIYERYQAGLPPDHIYISQ